MSFLGLDIGTSAVKAVLVDGPFSDPAWIFEGTAFRVEPRIDGACRAGQASMQRLFKPGTSDTGSRHRYALDAALVAQLVEQGWILEGHAFCVMPG